MTDEIKIWQTFLNTIGYALIVDGVYGPKTEAAFNAYRALHGLAPQHSIPLNPDGLPFPFVQARNYNTARRTSVSLIVIHTMEAMESQRTAANIAGWFASANSSPASAHYCIDESSVVQTVSERDIAWHASDVNPYSIGIEHAGFAAKTAEEWKNLSTQAMLNLSAKLAARIAVQYKIPLIRLTTTGVMNRLPGICGHIDVTNAFHPGDGHTDPGQNFPWNDYLALVQSNIDLLLTPPDTDAEEE